jgi:hypothetical protein
MGARPHDDGCSSSSVVWLFFKTFAAHKGSACASPI